MRRLMAISLILIFVGGTRTWAGNHNEEDQVKQEEAKKQTGREKEKGRVFRVSFELELEQKTGSDFTVEGKTIYGKSVNRVRSTLSLLDNQSYVWPQSHAEHSETDGQRHSEDFRFEMKIKSVSEDRLRLEVTAKKSRTEKPETDTSRSWNLSLEASKTVKIGEKIKLELGDEKTLDTKCTFSGIIEEIDPEKK